MIAPRILGVSPPKQHAVASSFGVGTPAVRGSAARICEGGYAEVKLNVGCLGRWRTGAFGRAEA